MPNLSRPMFIFPTFDDKEQSSLMTGQMLYGVLTVNVNVKEVSSVHSQNK